MPARPKPMFRKKFRKINRLSWLINRIFNLRQAAEYYTHLKETTTKKKFIPKQRINFKKHEIVTPKSQYEPKKKCIKKAKNMPRILIAPDSEMQQKMKENVNLVANSTYNRPSNKYIEEEFFR